MVGLPFGGIDLLNLTPIPMWATPSQAWPTYEVTLRISARPARLAPILRTGAGL